MHVLHTFTTDFENPHELHVLNACQMTQSDLPFLLVRHSKDVREKAVNVDALSFCGKGSGSKDYTSSLFRDRKLGFMDLSPFFNSLTVIAPGTRR